MAIGLNSSIISILTSTRHRQVFSNTIIRNYFYRRCLVLTLRIFYVNSTESYVWAMVPPSQPLVQHHNFRFLIQTTKKFILLLKGIAELKPIQNYVLLMPRQKNNFLDKDNNFPFQLSVHLKNSFRVLGRINTWSHKSLVGHNTTIFLVQIFYVVKSLFFFSFVLRSIWKKKATDIEKERSRWVITANMVSQTQTTPH